MKKELITFRNPKSPISETLELWEQIYNLWMLIKG